MPRIGFIMHAFQFSSLINIQKKTNYCYSFTTTEYVVFSYKSGRFARSLAIHHTRPALNSWVSINNTHSLTHTVRYFWSLLINTTSVCPIIRPRAQKWATSCCSKLHLDTTRTDISQFLDIATIITCTTIEAANEKTFVRIDCADA